MTAVRYPGLLLADDARRRGGRPPIGEDTILRYGICAGIVAPMGAARKITVEVPEDLLRKAQRSTGSGITATIRAGLELVAAKRAYASLRKLRGKVKFSVSIDDLREDRA